MTFYSESIQKEFERLIKQHPDIEEYKHPLINVSDALKAYFALADYFTDESSNTTETMLVGIRSMDLLYSALSRQTVSFENKRKYSHPLEICSTLFFGMAFFRTART